MNKAAQATLCQAIREAHSANPEWNGMKCLCQAISDTGGTLKPTQSAASKYFRMAMNNGVAKPSSNAKTPGQIIQEAEASIKKAILELDDQMRTHEEKLRELANLKSKWSKLI
jgi:hypothetical protein